MTPLAALRRGDQVEPCCGFRLVGLPTAPFCPPLLMPEQQLNCKQCGWETRDWLPAPLLAFWGKSFYYIQKRKEPSWGTSQGSQITCFPMRRESMAFHSMKSLCVLDVFHRFVISPWFLHGLKAQQLSIYTFVLPCSSIMTPSSVPMKSDQFLSSSWLPVWEVIKLS